MRTIKPGKYRRTWAGYTVNVEVFECDGVLLERGPTGVESAVESMPDAIYEPRSVKDSAS